ncbi:lipocalin family protein [Photobacterium angustum]|uniref:Lipocalin-like domain-containing protein n=1 Tax=Photobacterium angustum (strain S14 / CCUG 15956) TaxID=314292 RepID=Q1ZQX5_PHOAS|nr:lipocalin family protein [Photobacterium angustum]EAS64636.1 hypothetical protein VAS14_02933 [Photobacterium angustum S14]
MKKLFFIIVLFFFSTFSRPIIADDITEFDYPFLLGNWYWFSSTEAGVESEGESYRAMHVMFKSDYAFAMRLLRTDGKIEQWSGEYNIDETNITFVTEGEEDQMHTYMLSYNQFVLDGARFTKLAPENLPGNWKTSTISGSDVDHSISELSLTLRPDFLFSAEVSNNKGKSKEHRGIYYIEDNQLVLLYEDGQHDSEFELSSNDTLTLTNTHFGMEAILQRE